MNDDAHWEAGVHKDKPIKITHQKIRNYDSSIHFLQIRTELTEKKDEGEGRTCVHR